MEHSGSRRADIGQYPEIYPLCDDVTAGELLDSGRNGLGCSPFISGLSRRAIGLAAVGAVALGHRACSLRDGRRAGTGVCRLGSGGPPSGRTARPAAAGQLADGADKAQPGGRHGNSAHVDNFTRHGGPHRRWAGHRMVDSRVDLASDRAVAVRISSHAILLPVAADAARRGRTPRRFGSGGFGAPLHCRFLRPVAALVHAPADAGVPGRDRGPRPRHLSLNTLDDAARDRAWPAGRPGSRGSAPGPPSRPRPCRRNPPPSRWRGPAWPRRRLAHRQRRVGAGPSAALRRPRAGGRRQGQPCRIMVFLTRSVDRSPRLASRRHVFPV